MKVFTAKSSASQSGLLFQNYDFFFRNSVFKTLIALVKLF